MSHVRGHGPTGFEPRTTPAERRAFFELHRRVDEQHEQIEELQKLASAGELGPDNAGPTSGTTPLVIDTITVPDQGPGTIHAFANAYVAKTVGSDRFSMILRINGSAVNQASEPTSASAVFPFSLSGSLAVAGGAPVDVEVTLVRSIGTGTASIGVGSQCHLHYIFIPTP